MRSILYTWYDFHLFLPPPIFFPFRPAVYYCHYPPCCMHLPFVYFPPIRLSSECQCCLSFDLSPIACPTLAVARSLARIRVGLASPFNSMSSSLKAMTVKCPTE